MGTKSRIYLWPTLGDHAKYQWLDLDDSLRLWNELSDKFTATILRIPPPSWQLLMARDVPSSTMWKIMQKQPNALEKKNNVDQQAYGSLAKVIWRRNITTVQLALSSSSNNQMQTKNEPEYYWCPWHNIKETLFLWIFKYVKAKLEQISLYYIQFSNMKNVVNKSLQPFLCHVLWSFFLVYMETRKILLQFGVWEENFADHEFRSNAAWMAFTHVVTSSISVWWFVTMSLPLWKVMLLLLRVRPIEKVPALIEEK